MTQPAELPSSERLRVHALLKLHGWNASSFQTLASDFSYWFDGPAGHEYACVGYLDTGRAWVAAGAPIADPDRIAAVALRFVEAARAAHRRASFFGTEGRFTAAVPFGALHIGEQPVWNPQLWDAALRSSADLREQIRRARAKGVLVRELLPAELGPDGSLTRGQLEALMQRWLEAHPLPPMRFLVQLDPFTFLDDKRCWLAEREGQSVGLLVAVPVYQRQGWLFENLLRDARTPNGTTELLIASAMRAVGEQGCTYVTLGLVPLSGAVGALLRAARFLGRGLYDFEGLRRFKTKLKPTAWSPIFLSVPAPQPRALAILDVLSAFAGGSLGLFGLEALWSKPAFLARALALSLVPWTVALALASPLEWFPSKAIWASWILFDLLLIAALSWLGQRWRTWLGLALASCITVDAGLTLFQALRFNLARTQGAASMAAVVVAVLGPTAAAFFLWHAACPGRRLERR